MGDDAIYRSVSGDLMRFAAAVGGREDAADIVATVVGRALARPGGLSGLDEPKPYLIRAIVNEVRSRHRPRSRRGEVSIESVPEPMVQSSSLGILDSFLALPPRQRAALYLTAYQGYTSAEVAALMGCRPATVRRYVHLGRARLKETLDG